MEQNI
jgi:hypothetical protein